MSLPNTALPALACLGTVFSQPALATGNDAWNYEAPHCLHAGATQGDVGVTGKADASFSDIWDPLDMGFMGMLTARQGHGDWASIWSALHESGRRHVAVGDGALGKVTVKGALDIETSLEMAMASVGCRPPDDRPSWTTRPSPA